MRAGLDSLKWSVNAADEGQFVRIMGVAGRLYHRALDNIRHAWEARSANGFSTKLYASSIRYDNEQHQRMEALLTVKVRPYVDQHYWLPLYSMGPSQPSGRRISAIDRPLAIRVESVRCASRCRAGRRLPRGTSPRKASFQRVVLMRRLTGRWVI